MKEIWKEIPNYSRYKCSNKGQVKSLNYKRTGKEKIIKQQLDKRGYPVVKLLNDNSDYKTITVHRIVAITFLSNPTNKKTVNHINGIKNDNRLENLEWSTNRENFDHAVNNGLLVMFGENAPNAKLTKKDVLEIREKYEPYRYTSKMLGKEYGVSYRTIKGIIAGNSWSHL